jgi:CheY-like chemotaxis protein
MICKISDSGIGLTAGEIEKIFKAFSQGDHAKNDSSYRFGGLGLGLAISTKLVELHNGSIEARSSGRNQGATFIITLPLTEVLSLPVAPFEQNSQPTLSGSSKSIDVYRILLVEDHESTRNTLAQLLERRGYEVTCAQNVASARRMASEREHNVIISDIGLPDGNGYELITELHEQYGLLAIALTGYGMETDIARSEASGFILHLTKPVRIQTLETALAKIRAIK